MNIACPPTAMVPATLPNWVPEGALHYLAHTELGQPIRALARSAGCHASTILRQIRKIETRRDDPLVDAALRRLGAAHQVCKTPNGAARKITQTSDPLPDEDTLNREALRILRRLCETGAVLAVAAEMDKAVVVRDMVAGGTARTAVVASSIAQAMALKDWIAAANQGRIVRYHITTAGRAALGRMLEDTDLMKTQDAGSGATQIPFAGTINGWDNNDSVEPESARARRMRYSLAESPLVALSRRRDHTGKPFLSDPMVGAGERLREDFELGQMGGNLTQNWDKFLTPGTRGSSTGSGSGNAAASEARARVASALADLGPGLSDVVTRCCCYLEGLETTEKRLGWSARSGKIVLRIALMRLQRHYEATIGPNGPLIG